MEIKYYHDVKFSAETIKGVCEKFYEQCGKHVKPSTLESTINGVLKEYSSLEELLSNYEQASNIFIAI